MSIGPQKQPSSVSKVQAEAKAVASRLEKLVAPEWMFGDSIEARNALQNCGKVHPYTCGNPDCREILRAVEDGWVCDKCGYTQPNGT